jgi:hypothetical protein
VLTPADSTGFSPRCLLRNVPLRALNVVVACMQPVGTMRYRRRPYVALLLQFAISHVPIGRVLPMRVATTSQSGQPRHTATAAAHVHAAFSCDRGALHRGFQEMFPVPVRDCLHSVVQKKQLDLEACGESTQARRYHGEESTTVRGLATAGWGSLRGRS